jgi:hypothetical protein
MQSPLKTSQPSTSEASIASSPILPRSGLMRRGVLSNVERPLCSHSVPVTSCWPSPTKEDARASRRHGYTITGHSGTTLTDAMLQWYGLDESEDSPWVLNPDFSEALLGLPAGWTNVDDASACDALETPSAQIKLF